MPRTLAMDGVEGEELAAGSDAMLLITGSASLLVEALARRIHATGGRAALPFVQAWACDLPTDRQLLDTACQSLLDAAAGGTILISDVEAMPRVVQDTFIELLAGRDRARTSCRPVRLISGTTVSMLDRIAAGAFSDRLFYRLNTIHLLLDDW